MLYKFDVIIGNPPYQIDDKGAKASASPIYHLFVYLAINLQPKYISMIIPARWLISGKGLDEFRDKMLRDTRIKVLHDIINSRECFPEVKIQGGICFFLWDKDYNGLCKIYTHLSKYWITVSERKLLDDKYDFYVRYNEAVSILNKIKKRKELTLDTNVSSRSLFGLDTNFKDFSSEPFENSILLYGNGFIGYIREDQVAKKLEYVNTYKVLISKANGGSFDLPNIVISKPFMVGENTCCTETYLIIGPYKNKIICENVIKYVKTKFCRFLISLLKNTQNATKKVYTLVPLQDFNEEWTDEKLYKKYKLGKREINFIEKIIKPME